MSNFLMVLLGFLVKYSEDSGSYMPTTAGFLMIIGIMIAALLAACYAMKPDENGALGTRRLVFSSMAIALATVTSMIKLFHLPMGGSITLLSMLFVALIGYWYGLGTGLLAAFAYGLLQMILDPYIISLPQMLVDYVFAFTALGLSGVFSKAKYGLIKGYILAILGRWFFAFLSGYIFFGSYAADYGMSAWAYSAVYNGIYIFTEAAVTIVILLIPAVNKAMQRVKAIAVQGNH
ncbi:MAG: energy-coupled thiamine transporter ThiT [Eubacterium sp.]|nr:energy-coupled thiamine transporter ThiT [Eubacterium sp.]